MTCSPGEEEEMSWSRTLPTLIWLAAVGFALGALIALS